MSLNKMHSAFNQKNMRTSHVYIMHSTHLGKKKKNNSEKWMGSLCVHTYCYKTHQTEETTLLRKKNKTWEKKKLPFSN